ncbi:DNA invertase Pin-like site-specific DNA recombinase [Paucibacter oligotrophus]|uniref:DNA invertase Pin-like site-specific DNA recombinase n=1 Tax=Roseateles oligotrophus TaxID=1769250 RepID=A0A840L190_9BURK|nr:recombinase family protein [Roseateles oligotrophus]MBB4842214.1 DNA invertase Pin-like site-specific DNA recombinase [Roseateles oligotrophus]
MEIGYARVSSTEQETTLQRDALRRAKVRQVVEEKRSSMVVRPALEAMLDGLQSGDVVVVYKVDRFARSLSDLLRILDRIERAGASFRSLTEPIDTANPAGRMMMHLLGAFAEFERSMIRQRCMAGQLAAWERGVKLGRRRVLTARQEKNCYRKWQTGKYTMTALAEQYGCHLSSIKRVILRVEKPESSAVAFRMGKK